MSDTITIINLRITDSDDDIALAVVAEMREKKLNRADATRSLIRAGLDARRESSIEQKIDLILEKLNG